MLHKAVVLQIHHYRSGGVYSWAFGTVNPTHAVQVKEHTKAAQEVCVSVSGVQLRKCVSRVCFCTRSVQLRKCVFLYQECPAQEVCVSCVFLYQESPAQEGSPMWRQMFLCVCFQRPNSVLTKLKDCFPLPIPSETGLFDLLTWLFMYYKIKQQ